MTENQIRFLMVLFVVRDLERRGVLDSANGRPVEIAPELEAEGGQAAYLLAGKTTPAEFATWYAQILFGVRRERGEGMRREEWKAGIAVAKLAAEHKFIGGN